VLAAFMGGLAIGAWAAGTHVRLIPSDIVGRLRAYATIEVAVAVFACLVPLALAGFFPVLSWAYADGAGPVRFALVRVGICLLLVGIPAAAMGATFPIAVGAMARSRLDAGLLYAANTAGAAGGAIAAGFWLIPWLGLRGTTWIGVALNLAAASGALWIARAWSRIPATPPLRASAIRAAPVDRLRSSRPRRPTVDEPAPGLACAATAVSGFSALVYEVAWTRLLALVIGPTTYAFATMAAVFITGLAIGSTLGARVARGTSRPVAWLAALLAAGAVAATIAAWYGATRLPLSVAVQVADPSADLSGVVWRQAIAVGLLLLPMTLALGASFPLALAVAGAWDDSARNAARLYAANTAGAVAGALSAGFVLIPAFGLRESIRGAALAAVLGGALVFVLARGPKTKDGPRPKNQGPRTILTCLLLTAGAFAAVLAVPSWDRSLLASGAYKYAPYLAGADLEAVLRAGTLDYYKEGPSGTISVRELTGTRSMAIDGKVDASSGGDMLTQRLLGLLPVLLHGHAEEVAIVGLGSGVTAGSALAPATVRRADVIEISPEVVEASHFFDLENGHVLAQPEVHLIVGDGRSHLLLTARRYDVIVSEPSNPWMAGVATLFTREFFEAAKSRLKPDGLMCQWAHTYDIHLEDLQSIVGTFTDVFPQSTMWLVGGGDLLLIGAKTADIVSRLPALAGGTRQPQVEAALAGVGVAPGTAAFALLSLFAGGPGDLARFAAEAPIQTDDRTALEYSAPRGIYGRTSDDNTATIRALAIEAPSVVREAFEHADDAAWTSRGTMDLRAQAFATAYEAFHRAATLNPRNAAALSGLSDAAGGANLVSQERDWLQATATREPGNAAVRIELSRVLAVLGDLQGAGQSAARALQLTPDDPRAAEQLASVLADASDAQGLAALAGQIVSKFPERADSWYYRATAFYLAGRTEEAIADAERVVAAHPEHARAQSLLGTACAALGRHECAQAAFEASIRANPRDASGYINAGVFKLQMANPSSAEMYFASALAIDPHSAPARDGVAQVRALAARR
jgi:spermidine synthase